ncbi:TPA: toll/interleukin-1 receptor domain-containing protein [Bacillus wiedmannii]|nr:toll/interleukin-1 receptor domain-containing protein [Bacillus wiedmannii]
MRKISITIINNQSHIRCIPLEENVVEDGFCVDFFINKENIPSKEILPIVRKFASDIDWISLNADGLFLNLSKMKRKFQSLFHNCEWMKGEVKVEPQFDEDCWIGIPIVSYQMTKNQVERVFPKKIFLSHKGSNKDFVMNYYKILKELGFDPWIDDEDMHVGAPNRAILKGLQESCACIFFITSEFKDERHLAFEIDCAQKQNIDRGEEFSIITLQFTDEMGEKGVVPDLLQISIWKTPKNDLEALKYILKGLPIKVGTVDWK